MGQVPFNPPNVSGWEGGTAWLSTSVDPGALRRRVGRAAQDRVEEGSIPRDARRRRPAIDRAVAATGRPRVGAASPRARCAATPRSAVAGRTEKWEVDHYYPERQRVLRHLLLAGPEAQVC